MKVFNFIAKHWKVILIYPIVICCLFVMTCFFFNFLLVPAKNSCMVEAVMTEAMSEKENIETMFIGSSRTYRGVNSYELSKILNKNIFDIAYEQASYSTSYYLLQELTKKHKPESIFIEVSIANLFRSKSTEDLNAYKTLSGNIKDEFAKVASINYNQFYLLDFTNYMENFSNEKFVQNVKLKVMKNYKVGDIVVGGESDGYCGKGFVYTNIAAKETDHLALPLSYGSTIEWNENDVNEIQLDYLMKIIEFCKNHNIKCYIFSPPFPYSVSQEMKDVFEGFDQYIKENFVSKGIKYIDFAKTKKELVNLSNVLFYDGNHCNKEGADAMLSVYASVLTDLGNNTFNSGNYFYSSFEEMIADYES